MDAAQTIKTMRHRAGLTQADLAARVGITASVLSAYERGRRAPGAEIFLRLIHAAGFEPTWTRRLDDREQGRRLVEVLELAQALPYRPRPMSRARIPAR